MKLYFFFNFRRIDASAILSTPPDRDNKYDDLVTVDSYGTRNGSVRIVKAELVKHGTMSRRVGSMVDHCTNIHTEEDLKQAEISIQKSNE